MAATYDDHGVRFEYPEEWEVEVTDEGTITTVAVQSPNGLAFALVTVDDSCQDPADVAGEALTAMREEYPTLDSVPAQEAIAGYTAIGHDVEFISLDMTNSCSIRSFRTPRRTVLVFGQWSDLAGEENEALISGIRCSLEENDEAPDRSGADPGQEQRLVRYPEIARSSPPSSD